MIDPIALRDVFDRAVTLPPQERAAFLTAVCDGNPNLRKEVERLLAADARGGSLFDSSAYDSDPAVMSATKSERSAAHRFSLALGTRLGPYEITGLIGAGGMGEVYRARDTRLDRVVALKVLTSTLSADASANKRFEREARAVAALSHPHICPLFDIGHQDGIEFLVMEYLKGETLAARLQRGKVPLEDALGYTAQIAHALAAAHRVGIVHRDLKPGNIMLTASGARLLDFGLAKHRENIAPDAPGPAFEPITRTGTILGTIQYMAPEQLQGHDADERTDIFALGAVLYEMVTGKRAFDGGSTAEVIANILHSEPPRLSAIEPLSPRSLDVLVRGCLAKNPSDRWPSIADVHERVSAIHPAVAGSDVLSRRRLTAILIVGLLAAVTAMLAWRLRSSRQSETEGQHAAPVQRTLTRLTFDDGLAMDPTFSPDGRFVAYASDRNGSFDIWVQQLSGGDPVQVTKSPEQETQPAWSPDGSTIVFRSERNGGGLYVIPALGGPERLLVNEGLIRLGRTTALRSATKPNRSPPRKAMASTRCHLGEERPANSPGSSQPGDSGGGLEARPDGSVSFLGSDDKRGYGFYTVSAQGAVIDSHMLQHAPSELTNLKHSGGQRFHWINDRELILETESNSGVLNIWKVRIDPAELEWTSFERLTTGAGADAMAAMSPDRAHLLFGTLRISDQVWQFTLDGIRHRLAAGKPMTEESGRLFGVDASPDGTKLAYGAAHAGVDQIALWSLPLTSGRPQLVADMALFPAWSPDGGSLAYVRAQPDIKDPARVEQAGAVAIRQTGRDELIVTPWSQDWPKPCGWLDNDTVLVCRDSKIVAVPVTRPLATRPERMVFDGSEFGLGQATVSPNRRWLSFTVRRSDRPGHSGIGFSTLEGHPRREWTPLAATLRWAEQPRWSSDGKTLYFLTRESGRFMNLWGIAFDPDVGKSRGEPFFVTDFKSPAFEIIPSGLNVVGGKGVPERSQHYRQYLEAR